ncbi:AMP-binding protein [Dyella jejuensis]
MDDHIEGGSVNFEQLFTRADKFASALVSAKLAGGGDCAVTFDELVGQVGQLADKLASAGLIAGMQIGLQAPNCYEYLLWDLAAVKVGAVIHAVPEDLQSDMLAAIARKQSIALWVCEKPEHIPEISNKVSLADTLTEESFPVDRNAVPVTDGDLHSRVYSSGSSGYLKGLNISRRGTELLVSDFISAFDLKEADSHLIFLPLSNYQQRLSVYGCLWSGTSFKVARHTTVFQDIGRYKPSFIIAPPAIYENVYNLYGRAADAKEKLAAFLGGNIRFMITGMAPIRFDVLKAFNDLGFPLLEAYGVTETGVIAWNTRQNQRVGTVGKPIHPGHVHLTDDSEVIIRRPFPLSKGYFDSTESDSANTFLNDGSIATGDIGALDADGYLTLNGRKKEIIVTSSGAKFHPEELERSLSSLGGVNHCIVLMSKSDGRLVAVLFVAAQGDSGVASSIESGVQAVNASLPDYKKIHRWVLTDAVPSIDNGMLTRNLKYDRKGTYRHFQVEIERQKGRHR